MSTSTPVGREPHTNLPGSISSSPPAEDSVSQSRGSLNASSQEMTTRENEDDKTSEYLTRINPLETVIQIGRPILVSQRNITETGFETSDRLGGTVLKCSCVAFAVLVAFTIGLALGSKYLASSP